jgi:hypothetical protein
MESRDVIKFRSINESYPTVPRGVYNAVNSHIIGRALLTDMAVSKLDYLIASTHKQNLFDIDVTSGELRDIINRLPVLVACGGHYIAKGPPRDGNISTAIVPTPVTPSHFDRIMAALQTVAAKLGVAINGLSQLSNVIDIVFACGVNSSRYMPRNPNNEFSVEYHYSDVAHQNLLGWEIVQIRLYLKRFLMVGCRLTLICLLA